MKYGLDVSTIGEYSHPQTLADLALEAEQAGWDGVYPGRVDGESMTPETLSEIIAYTKEHRQSSEPFDVAVFGHTPSDPKKAAEMVQPFIEAGATWWTEGSRESLDEMRERVRSGPPKLP